MVSLLFQINLGYGRLKKIDGTIYKGNFKDDKFDGFGILLGRGDDRIEGYWSKGEFIGEITQEK